MKIHGTVVHGKHIGRTLGFPTANIQPDAPVQGMNGVYAAWLELDGEQLGCMVNFGRHPTLPEGKKTIEAHIFDFSGDIYGREVSLQTVQLLRGEVKFPSPEELRRQLERDACAARDILKNSAPE